MQFGFSEEQMGYIITASLLAYTFGQIINGLITDKLGGKRAMLIGAAGTIAMNVLFRRGGVLGHPVVFVMISGIDGLLQAYGDVGHEGSASPGH